MIVMSIGLQVAAASRTCPVTRRQDCSAVSMPDESYSAGDIASYSSPGVRGLNICAATAATALQSLEGR